MATTFAQGPDRLAGPRIDPVGSDSSKAWRAGISGQVKRAASTTCSFANARLPTTPAYWYGLINARPEAAAHSSAFSPSAIAWHHRAEFFALVDA
jgi:hypothetical protein